MPDPRWSRRHSYFDRLDRERLIRHYTRRLAELGAATAGAPAPVPA
jgi:hypothetical protein